MSYALVIGKKSGGKSDAMREIADGLAARGLRVAGFTQRVIEEGPGRKSVELVRLVGGETRKLARTSVDPGADPSVCSFVFDAGAFKDARRWVEADLAGADIVVLDGVGKLELGGGGHRDAIDLALRDGRPVVLSVREDNLGYALENLALEEPVACYGPADSPAALTPFLDTVVKAAARP